AAIVAAFLLAILYLSAATGLSAAGYEAQRLEAERDEFRRQNALLELEIARLDSPARLEAEAGRLGLVRVAHVPVLTVERLAAVR
ncbi:MAG: hypothetical protein ACRDF0_06975, partial [Candidatus Limnocylindria bacterium]